MGISFEFCMVWFLSLFSNEILKIEASYQPYRTAFHFQPPKNWMNDPNGPMIYKGIYHLFYQWNPMGAVGGNKTWGHSTSTDLVNWTAHDLAIIRDHPYDINGCWSGSATILPGGAPAILYTGKNFEKKQVQNLALPQNLSDPYLKVWVKSPLNPLISPNDQNHINSTSFRDPTTAWFGPDKQWRMIIGSKINREGIAILFKSKDFVHWDHISQPFHSAKDNGMWECPDFFPVSTQSSEGVDTSHFGVDIKHVLKVSLDDTRHEYYTIGTYDLVKDIYVPDPGSVESDAGLRYDYGKFYASKSFFDSAKMRRILWGWINESSTVDDDIKKGWSGIQAIPREIWLDPSGKQIVQWPVQEISKLRTNRVTLKRKTLEGGSIVKVFDVTGSRADVDISFMINEFEKAEVIDPNWTNPQELCSLKGASVRGSLGPFGLLVLASKDLDEHTSVFFRIFKGINKYVVLMCSDQSRSSLNLNNDMTTYGAFVKVDIVHQKLSLRSLIDHSIVESYGGGGKACITARVYPTLAIDDEAYLYVFNNGTEPVLMDKLNAWSMKKAKIN